MIKRLRAFFGRQNYIDPEQKTAEQMKAVFEGLDAPAFSNMTIKDILTRAIETDVSFAKNLIDTAENGHQCEVTLDVWFNLSEDAAAVMANVAKEKMRERFCQ